MNEEQPISQQNAPPANMSSGDLKRKEDAKARGYAYIAFVMILFVAGILLQKTWMSVIALALLVLVTGVSTAVAKLWVG